MGRGRKNLEDFYVACIILQIFGSGHFWFFGPFVLTHTSKRGFGLDQDLSGRASIMNDHSSRNTSQAVCSPAYVGFFLKHFCCTLLYFHWFLQGAVHEINPIYRTRARGEFIWLVQVTMLSAVDSAQEHTLVSAQVLLSVVPVDEKLINQTKPTCLVGFLLLIVGIQLSQPLWPYDYKDPAVF